jgi:hypothetical protein
MQSVLPSHASPGLPATHVDVLPLCAHRAEVQWLSVEQSEPFERSLHIEPDPEAVYTQAPDWQSVDSEHGSPLSPSLHR